MLGLYAMQNGFLMQFVNHNQWRRQAQLHKAESILQQIERNHTKQCYISSASRSYLLAQSLDWWKSRPECTGMKENDRYFYVIEALGESPCAYINDSKIDKSPYYYRITLLFLSSKNEEEKHILQSTIIKMDNTLRKCEGKLHKISPGRQMWRILT